MTGGFCLHSRGWQDVAVSICLNVSNCESPYILWFPPFRVSLLCNHSPHTHTHVPTTTTTLYHYHWNLEHWVRKLSWCSNMTLSWRRLRFQLCLWFSEKSPFSVVIWYRNKTQSFVSLHLELRFCECWWKKPKTIKWRKRQTINKNPIWHTRIHTHLPCAVFHLCNHCSGLLLKGWEI